MALSVALILLSTVTPLLASWPQRPVRIITPLSAGTGTDFVARLFAARLAERWGKPVIVENRPGGDGIVGVTAFVDTHDDHTLLFSVSAMIAMHAVAHRKPPYDPKLDLVPISSASNVLFGLAATQSLKISSLAELTTVTRWRPRELNWGACPGLCQYVFAGFLASAELHMTAISYREPALALHDLGEGRLHLLIDSLAGILPLVHSGKARLLAVSNRTRPSVAADVPTAAEAGFPELAMDGFSGFFGWRGMPRELQQQIAADVRAVAADWTINEQLLRVGQVAHFTTPAEFNVLLKEEHARMTALARAIGVTPIH